MDTTSNDRHSPEDPQAARPAVAMPRPVYWSLQRELWENRSIYLAPLAVASVVLFGSFISAAVMAHRLPALLTASAARQHSFITSPYNYVAGLTLMTAFIVGVFYCLDALYNERRDRSILFWKSLPVSDRVTVLTKASIPLVVLPVLAWAIVLTAHLVIIIVLSMVLAGSPAGFALLSSNLKFVQLNVAFLYAVIAIALWHAPLYCWLLLVSAWARRAAFLWAFLPPVAIAVFEHTAFGTDTVFQFFGYRVTGWYKLAFVKHVKGSAPIDPLAAMTPENFFSTPGLWIGLLVAAGLLVATVRLRRYREPI
jgi:ABC-2 type transport system permease protein